MINNLAKEVHANAIEKGFFDSERNIGEMLCLIHSEVSEALEADRDNAYSKTDISQINALDDASFKTTFEAEAKNTFEDELADVLIRVMDLAAYKGVDLEQHLQAKMRYNKLRAHKHGKKY